MLDFDIGLLDLSRRKSAEWRPVTISFVSWKRVTARHGAEFVKHVVPAVAKPARVLWNEIIGFFFLCFGVIFGFNAGKLYLRFAGAVPEEKGAALLRLVMASVCTLVMLYFAATSFLKARKIARS